jgi:hypothetical protein
MTVRDEPLKVALVNRSVLAVGKVTVVVDAKSEDLALAW